MNAILLSFAIVITLVNLALALSTFGYIVEMNKHMDEWFKMFKELVEICGDICYGNAHTIENVTKYTEYMKNMFIKKDKDIQELNDKYDKLYEEFKKLEETVDECRDYRFEKYLKGLDPDVLLERQYEEETDRDGDEENDDGLSSFWHEENELEVLDKIREMSMNKLKNTSVKSITDEVERWDRIRGMSMNKIKEPDDEDIGGQNGNSSNT